jgi:hypothetical protein
MIGEAAGRAEVVGLPRLQERRGDLPGTKPVVCELPGMTTTMMTAAMAVTTARAPMAVAMRSLRGFPCRPGSRP